MPLSRKVKALELSNTLFSQFLHEEFNLPSDVRIRYANYDGRIDTLFMTIESVEFPEIPEGCIPDIFEAVSSERPKRSTPSEAILGFVAWILKDPVITNEFARESHRLAHEYLQSSTPTTREVEE